MVLKNNWLTKCFEFKVLKSSISTAINPPDYSNQLFISGITAERVHEGVDLRMRDVALTLAIDCIESCFAVPIWLGMEYFLEHFYLDMRIQFSLKVFSHCLFN